MIDTEIANKVLEQVLAHPESHRQWCYEDTSSLCGTTRCIGGWAIYFKYGRPVYANVTDIPTDILAAHALGINPREAVCIFAEMDANRAVELLKEVANGNEDWAAKAKKKWYLK